MMADIHSSNGIPISLPPIGIYLVSSLAILLPFSRAATSILTGLIVIYWICYSISTHANVLSGQPKLFWSIVAYILFALLSLLWTQDLARGFNDLGIYAYWLLIPALAGLLKRNHVDKVFNAFLAGMAISQLLFWGRHSGFITLKHGTTPFMNHIEYGVFLVATSIVLITKIMSPRYHKMTRVVLSMLLLTTVLALFTSTGLTGQVAFISVIPVAILIYSKISSKPLAIVFTSLILLMVTFGTSLLLSPSFFQNVSEYKYAEEALAGKEANNSISQRTGMIIIGIEIFMEHPLFGAGLGDNMHEYRRILHEQHPNFISTLDGFSKTHLHSQYLETATKTGLTGLILFSIVFYHYFRLPITDRSISVLRTLFAISFLAAFIGEPLWQKQFSTALFSFFTGLFVVASEQSGSGNRSIANN